MNSCNMLPEILVATGLRNDREYLQLLSVCRRLDVALKQSAGDHPDRIMGLEMMGTMQAMLDEYEYKAGDHQRVGEWIPTPTGLRFWLEDPRPEEINIEDIAHCLSRTPRFNGGTIGIPYSVAQHSVLTSLIVPNWAALPALLHDAHEAYIGDQTAPWKRAVISNLAEIERPIKAAIAEQFGFEWSDEAKAVVKKADNILLATETRDLMPFGVTFRASPEAPMRDYQIEPLVDEEAYFEFIERFEELTNTSIYV